MVFNMDSELEKWKSQLREVKKIRVDAERLEIELIDKIKAKRYIRLAQCKLKE